MVKAATAALPAEEEPRYSWMYSAVSPLEASPMRNSTSVKSLLPFSTFICPLHHSLRQEPATLSSHLKNTDGKPVPALSDLLGIQIAAGGTLQDDASHGARPPGDDVQGWKLGKQITPFKEAQCWEGQRWTAT